MPAGVPADGQEVAAPGGVRATAAAESGAAAAAGKECGDDGSGKPARGAGSATRPAASFAGRVNLTLAEMDIPLLTVLGLALRPGQARSLGALDPVLARRLAEAAPRSPASTFCVTIVNQEGHAIGHGCLKATQPEEPAGPARPAEPAGHGKSSQAGGGEPPGPAPPGTPGTFTFTPSGRAGPSGGYGAWTITLPGKAGKWTVDLHPVPTGECDHRYASAGHDPRGLLRHLVQVRDGKCGFPTCARSARESDFEHCQPHDQGGRTCGCNCWSPRVR